MTNTNPATSTTAWGPTPLQPYANARLLLRQTLIPTDSTSAVVATHVLECFLTRQRYISAKENGPGVDTGDFTYGGMICRASRLPPEPGAIWLGDLSLLNAAGDADVDPYALHHPFTALEFGASYGSGGIGALVQPLIGERVFGTLKPLLLS